MKKKVVLLLVLICAYIIYNNTNSRIIIFDLIRKSGIRSGDLKYRINLLGILPVGEAIFKAESREEYRGQKVYHLGATARPLKFYSKFFSSYAILDSYIDMQKFSPMLFKQRVEVPGRENPNKEVIYDQKNGTMSIAGILRQIPPDTQDPLSAIFNIRKMDFDKIKEFEMNINTNQKNYALRGKVRPLEIIINQQTYKIFILETNISRRSKNPYHRSSVTMVLLKDRENIPILIKVFASGVLLNAKLIEIK